MQGAVCPECPNKPRADPMGSHTPLRSETLSLQNSPALTADGSRSNSHPSQPGRFHCSRGCSGPPAFFYNTDTASQKLGVGFLFKIKARSRFLWQPSPSLSPHFTSHHARWLAAPGPHAPQPLTSPHSPLMAAPSPGYQGLCNVIINSDRSDSDASVPCMQA